MPRTRPWEVSDELWERVAPLIPQRAARPKGGRPPVDDRQMFAAIVYVLRTGIQWNALPRELGASSTVYDRFRNWEAQGFAPRACGKPSCSTMTNWWASLGTGKVSIVRRSRPLSPKPPSAPLPPTAANRAPNGVFCVIAVDCPWLFSL